MKPFIVICALVFTAIVAAHVARMWAEPRMAREPWFWLITIVAGALGMWAWRLAWTRRGA